MSVSVSSSDTPVGFVSSRTSSHQSQSDYDLYASSDDRRRGSVSSEKSRSKSGKPRWLGQVKDWLSVSEPSAQAFKEQKRSTYRKHGIDLKDPQAAAKMHLPIEKVPANAITSTRGPSPEKALKMAVRQRQARQSYTGHSNASRSTTSSNSSNPCSRELNPVAPWET